MSMNKVSYITKGISGTKHNVHVEKDVAALCVACVDGETALKVWQRYWFHYVLKDNEALVRCGRGPMLENVMMKFIDPNPIRDLKYIRL